MLKATPSKMDNFQKIFWQAHKNGYVTYNKYQHNPGPYPILISSDMVIWSFPDPRDPV